MIATTPSFKTIAAGALALAVAACGGHAPVRPGPQAVHPSPSVLAQNPGQSNPGLAAPCETPDTAPCYAARATAPAHQGYTSYGADGSNPIID